MSTVGEMPLKKGIQFIEAELLKADFQRALSKAHVDALRASIRRLGFIAPLYITEHPDEPERFLILDGQHRFEAGLREGLLEFPCVILPQDKIAEALLFLNVEKVDNIKDKGKKVYALYQYFLRTDRFATELQLIPTEPWLFPIAFALEEYGLKSGSLVEDFSKKLASRAKVFDLSLEEALPIRRSEGEILKELENLIDQTAQSYGIRDFFLKKAILAKAMKYAFLGSDDPRKRLPTGLDEEYGMEQGFAMISKEIISRDWSFLGA